MMPKLARSQGEIRTYCVRASARSTKLHHYRIKAGLESEQSTNYRWWNSTLGQSPRDGKHSDEPYLDSPAIAERMIMGVRRKRNTQVDVYMRQA